MIKRAIISIINILYLPIISRYVPLQTFRYGMCGGANMVLDAVLYFLVYNFVFSQQIFDIGFVAISGEIASFLVVFPITFISGLWLAKNISFQNSPLGGGTQSFRYFLVVLLNISIKYFGLKLFVGVWAIFPSVANGLLTVITVVVSYVLQKYFTFKGAN